MILVPPIKTPIRIYQNDEHKRNEKICTLREFLEMGRIKPGIRITVGNIIQSLDGTETFKDVETFWIGDATPYVRPTKSDGELGWDWESPLCQKYVLKVESF